MALLGTGWSLEVKTRMSYAKWFFSQLDKRTGIPFTLTYTESFSCCDP